MLDHALLAASLASRSRSLRVFFRDDDAGWANDALERLVTELRAAEVELDLAVIPAALDSESCRLVADLLERSRGGLHLHQHGYSHTNHQAEGRKCEFGPARSLELQRSDIERGHEQLRAAFGAAVEPIFTPPWNRCTEETVHALEAVGLRVLSRDSTAEPLERTSVIEVPVQVDWLKKTAGCRLRGEHFMHYLCEPLAAVDALGIMLHHAEMDAQDRSDLLRVIDVMRDSGKVEFTSIMTLAERRSRDHE